jgi:hypothetical protein
MCVAFKARAYVHLNRRDSSKLALEMLTDLADRIKQANYSHLHRIHSTACGRFVSSKDKSWVIDIDDGSGVSPDAVLFEIDKLQPLGEKLLARIPTKNGCHLITRPFNAAEFGKAYPTVDVHKNNPTVLYVP